MTTQTIKWLGRMPRSTVRTGAACRVCPLVVLHLARSLIDVLLCLMATRVEWQQVSFCIGDRTRPFVLMASSVPRVFCFHGSKCPVVLMAARVLVGLKGSTRPPLWCDGVVLLCRRAARVLLCGVTVWCCCVEGQHASSSVV